MAKKRKTLPKDFNTLLNGNIKELIAVFNSCEINARGGYGKQTAIAYPECTHELAKFLIEKGVDIAQEIVNKVRLAGCFKEL